jgi:ankyrin repeat protein
MPLTIKAAESSLRESATKGNFERVSEIIEQLRIIEGSIDAADDLGYTALHIAVCKDHVTIVDLLLSNGANPNIATPSGWTPLHTAAQEGHLETTERLLADLRTEADAKNEFRETPLDYAILEKHKGVEECISKFLKTREERWSQYRSGWCSAVVLGTRHMQKKEESAIQRPNKSRRRTPGFGH